LLLSTEEFAPNFSELLLLTDYKQLLSAILEAWFEQCLEHQGMFYEVQSRHRLLFLVISSIASHSCLHESDCSLLEPDCSASEKCSHTHLLE